MVNTLWLVRKLGDFSSELLSDNDVVILIQDGVLRWPTRKGWYVCKEDALARGLKVPEEFMKGYEEIVELIEASRRVIVW
ncbi:sulfur relay protein TusB/DsrH [Hydrogenivirga caldilitoris]|uniref:Sulfur relay protein TusB/DsrH n=1 Tax=Hydrogenivirga caldilitoris TaxID=246264 RepID=A0A497XVM9_9AQUI|nr:sulfurtransferase TusB [Hydrogenivirga caldilitoris]RLJ71212.1 sulfur relay protein TusB/DsrH [Hydrogenivirga caldilitoris]